jgi:hypothetical protein
MNISLADPLTWVVVLVAPVLIVALRWSFRRRKQHEHDHEPPAG